MRYMLPLYPFFCFFGALCIHAISLRFFAKKHELIFLLSTLSFLLLLIWPLSFMTIYTKENTRITASKWINRHIPTGKTIALEHWDDGLPLFGIEKYQQKILPMYEPETPEKWRIIADVLNKADYIIIASNRLYVPLQKLSDCRFLPIGKCYNKTAFYYRSLFQENLGFTKIAEFSVLPTIPFLNFPLNDQKADESFTVYDRPKIMIFKKNIL
jgi:hypothetical protein